ncbi:MAG: response regulator transcription factor [Coriobacteriales bacterium]|jgi:two-component system response regulator RegX3|nr:response regulator transcription factor [Coriobacteriales bacterium]
MKSVHHSPNVIRYTVFGNGLAILYHPVNDTLTLVIVLQESGIIPSEAINYCIAGELRGIEMSESPARILVVDDEPSITEVVSYNLRKEGYDVQVAADGAAAVSLVSAHTFDLVILDVMLPKMDGYEVLRHIRTNHSMPVLFLSARDTELDKVVGLEIGGDDYLAKPFGIRELIARVKALLRRTSQQESMSAASDYNEIIEVSGITLDEGTHMAVGPSGPIDLTPREFELLAALMRYAGKVLSRDQLLHDAWGWEYLVETKTVDTHVKRLRDKLEAAQVDPALIETVRGYGYRFKLV